MKRLTIAGLSLMALVGLWAGGASVASARDFWVKGAVLPTGKANGKTVQVVSGGPIIFTLKSPNLQVSCRTIAYTSPSGTGAGMIWNEAKGPEIIGRGEGTLKATECVNLTNAACVVAEPITSDNTSEVAGALVEEKGGGKIYAMFAPESWVEGTTLVSSKELPFSPFVQTGPGTCPVSVVVKGDGLAATISSETTELEKHVLQIPGKSANCKPIGAPVSPIVMSNGNEVSLFLKAAGAVAEECGEMNVRLVSGENWSVK
jgi:hypothetical protein